MTISVITATYNRPQQLYTVAFNSLLNQTDHSFEWVVVNDGCNPQTREMIATLQAPFPIAYLEIEHSSTGFGLCYARNAGLNIATGSLITYLDDDNSFEREFICATKHFFQQHDFVKYSMAIQKRRRDVVLHDKTIRSSKVFTSPSNSFCTLEQLISQQEIFDSNGFTHVHNLALKWNPNYQIFADYEFLLQCTKQYGNSTFKLHPQVLVNYIQSSTGTIGCSHYCQWATELKQILQDSSVYLLTSNHIVQLERLAQTYHRKALERPPAFV
ncbi:glycosyltransferase family 2 protein [Nostoc sp. MS1]|uniref:glycosyltransferase family 2 protein n=1 Tax=Nostoc sp. MS1 TaxID=2764711 RepID=UPI001CC35A28|nr:glycosyltransferase family A protein [Nostoc sp. MS1]BCL39650.1 hypothetical protein NSMS1_60970 [Nostoc sp. MS1]